MFKTNEYDRLYASFEGTADCQKIEMLAYRKGINPRKKPLEKELGVRLKKIVTTKHGPNLAQNNVLTRS